MNESRRSWHGAAVAALLAGLAMQPCIASEALADQHACLNCHAVDKKLVGPAFNAVAAKYRDVPDAVAKLAAGIEKGSSGVWGNVPMPGMPQVSAADREALAKWVLQTK